MKRRTETKKRSGVRKKMVKVNKGGKVCDRKGIMAGKSYAGV